MPKTATVPKGAAPAADAAAPKTLHVAAPPVGGLTLQAYAGDYTAMLVWTLEKSELTQHAGLAGFAITRTTPDGQKHELYNMLGFDTNLPKNATDQHISQQALPSSQAPFQKFRWIDFPSVPAAGTYGYDVTAMYFSDPKKSTPLVAGATAHVDVQLADSLSPHVKVGFTRGFISSQAYAREFKNAGFRPDKKTDSTYLYDTAPFEPQYVWAGRRARTLLFEFLDAAIADRKAGKKVTLDAFVYDVDEPDFVRRLQAFGTDLRLFLDNSENSKDPKVKPDRAGAADALKLPAANIRRGLFKRFAHCKVLIRRDDGKPTQVLTGSANFSVRGLYVQGNSIIVIDDPDVAKVYDDVFEMAFGSEDGGEWQAAMAKPELTQWQKFQRDGLPHFGVSFAPHANGDFAIGALARTLNRAKRNVIFAIMQEGTGIGQETLMTTIQKPGIFGFGVMQNDTFETKLIASGKKTGQAAASGKYGAYAPLSKTVPEPFLSEMNVGMGGGANSGQVIHHKFVVVDFNGDNPTVYCGSSNLAQGGENQNGDNLLAIYDAEIATMYAIEGIQLADHYSFRYKLSQSGDDAPMTLQGPGASPPWYADYYTPGTKHQLEMQSLLRAT